MFEEVEERLERLKRGQKELKDPAFASLLKSPGYLEAALSHLRALAIDPSGRHPASWEAALVSPIRFSELFDASIIHQAAITEWDDVDLDFIADLSESLSLSVLEVDTALGQTTEATEEIHRIIGNLIIEAKQQLSVAPADTAIKTTCQDMQLAVDGLASDVSLVAGSMPVSTLPTVIGFELLFQALRAFVDIRSKSAAADVDSLVKDLLKDFDFRLNGDCEHLLEFIRAKSSSLKKFRQQQQLDLVRLLVSQLQHMNSLAQQELQWLEGKCTELENTSEASRRQSNKWAAAKLGLGTAALGAATIATGGAAAVLVLGGAIALGSSAADKRSAGRSADILSKVKGLVAHVAEIRTHALGQLEKLELSAARRN